MTNNVANFLIWGFGGFIALKVSFLVWEFADFLGGLHLSEMVTVVFCTSFVIFMIVLAYLIYKKECGRDEIMSDNHIKHIDIALAESRATTDAGHHLQGGHTVCPYREGTAERAAYDEQWKRMMRLAGEL